MNEIAPLVPRQEVRSNVVDAASVHRQLDRILASPSFRNSKRLPRFLRFVIEQSLAGYANDIKERTLGIEVFDRPADYDLTNDPIVRVTAGDIRKRIAQYYVQEGRENELRLVLVPGSYVPHFFWPKSEDRTSFDLVRVDVAPDTVRPIPPMGGSPAVVSTETPSPRPQPTLPPPVRSRLRRGMVWLAAGFILALLSVGIFLWSDFRPSHALENFWSPLMSGGTATMLCISNHKLSGQPLPGEESSIMAQFTETHARLGVHDVIAITRVAGFLGSNGRPFFVTMADNATLTDLRNQPAVFIGAFNNAWTPRIQQGLRFQFRKDTQNMQDQLSGIVDARAGTGLRWSIDSHSTIATIAQDFGIITRRISPITGQPDLVIAGTGPYGTVAATDFIINPSYFEQFSTRALRGWENRDIQIVITTDVVNGRAGPPRMVTFDIR
jgi:hypothetical protein